MEIDDSMIDKEIHEVSNKEIHEVSSHNNTGTRFLFMKMSFDMIEGYYTKDTCLTNDSTIPPDDTEIVDNSFLRIHLKYWIFNILKTKAVTYCKPKYGKCYVLRNPRKCEDGRRELPTSIYEYLKTFGTPWRSKKVTLTWISCYLFNVDIDCTTNLKWENFQCSHRCLGAGEKLICLNSRHLVWELTADNQSRGSTSKGRRTCSIICKCFKSHVVENHTICVCYKIHDPPCCEPLLLFNN